MNILAETGVSRSALLTRAFAAMPGPAFVVDDRSRILAANAGAARIFCDFPGLAGRGLAEVLDCDAAALTRDILDAVSGSPIFLRRPRRGGNRAERLTMQVIPLSQMPDHARTFLLAEGNKQLMLGKFSRLTDELKEAVDSASREREQFFQLQSQFRELEQFSRVAAHDLKAPLHNISSVLGFIEEDFGDDLPPEGLEYIGMARDAADRLHQLIASLLAHARSTVASVERRPLRIVETLGAVRKSLSMAITRTNATLETEGDLGEIEADPILFHQLLENLIGNSIKYRAPDREPVIRIRAEPREQGARFVTRLELRDNGRGFDPAHNRVIFQAFRRLESDAEIEGTGLGLATCEAICGRHGWKIEADGIPDVGATFRVKIAS